MIRVLMAAIVGCVAWTCTATAQQPKSLVIGIDGMGYGDFGFAVASTPNMDSLINGTWRAGYRGGYSQAFAGGVLGTPTQQITVSGPGWSTIHTGVWVDRHNMPDNSFSNPDYANNPSYLETLEQNVPGLHSASIVNWTPIDTHIISSVNDANSQMDFRSTPGNDVNVANAAASHIGGINTAAPAAIFIHFDEVDGAGHSSGSGSPAYGAEISNTDGLVGQLLNAVGNRPNYANEDWQIIVTSDHGHTSSGGHGGQSSLERTVPFIVASKHLNQGSLPTFPQQVSQADVAPTVLDHFGVTIPDHYYGISRADGAFIGNADINGDGIISGDGTGLFEDDDVVAFVSLWLEPNTMESPNPADLNLDGVANLADWAILNAAHPALGGAIFSALSGQEVPEPDGLIIALGAAAGICAARRGQTLR